jgi:hypothetical protein
MQRITKRPPTTMPIISPFESGGFEAAAATAEDEEAARDEVLEGTAVWVGVPSVQLDWHPLAMRQLWLLLGRTLRMNSE